METRLSSYPIPIQALHQFHAMNISWGIPFKAEPDTDFLSLQDTHAYGWSDVSVGSIYMTRDKQKHV